MAYSLGELSREYSQRATAAGLSIDCLMDGDVNSTVAIIGEWPERRACEMKLPFTGGAGKLVWDTLNKFGLRRQNVYMTYMVKKRLIETYGTGKTEGISKNELSYWKAMLTWELSCLPNLRYVLILGNLPLEALTGHTGIDKWRGSVLACSDLRDDLHVVVAHNPSLMVVKPSLEPIFKLDCQKLHMVMQGQWTPHHITPIYDTSPTEAKSWCDKMIQEDAAVSFDIEVVSGETACVGLANDAHTGMCINFRGRMHNRWTPREESQVRQSIQRVLRHAKVQLVAQNGGFDCGWLWYKDRIKVRPLWMDTLLAHHTMHPTWPHNLGFLTAQYTTHPFYKDDKDEWREGGDISSFWEYNVKDCCITWEVARRLHKELQSQKLWSFFTDHVMRLQPHLVSATVLGNCVDLIMREKLNNEYTRDVEALEKEFNEAARIATGDAELTVNPNSPKQLGELLFQRLRLTGKNASTNKENRLSMIENPRTSDAARHMLQILDTYSKQHKLLSTYISAAIDSDGRMRSDYKQYGVQNTPGRLSSSSTLWGSGMNLQNQPERLRGMFIADKIMIPESDW